MTYDEWLSLAAAYHVEHREQRLGQAYFNSLYHVRPDVANMVRTTEYDPYYADDSEGERLTRFFTKVQELW